MTMRITNAIYYLLLYKKKTIGLITEKMSAMNLKEKTQFVLNLVVTKYLCTCNLVVDEDVKKPTNHTCEEKSNVCNSYI